MSRDLVLEIGVEEMPAAIVDSGTAQLKEGASRILENYRLSYGNLLSFGTPRRLVLKVEKLAETQEKIVQEIKGPAKKVAYSEEGEPTPAALGFAKDQGVSLNKLVVRTTPHGEYLFALKEEKGKPTRHLLSSILPEIIESLSFPKSMRWDKGVRFVRPIRWLLALYDSKVVPFSLSNLKSSGVTFGHRFFCKNSLKIGNAQEYFQVLEKERVILSKNRRKDLTLRKIKEIERKVGGKALISPEVLEEALNLVEFPEVTWGTFPKDFLKIPKDILITVMEEHQRYFPIQKLKGTALLPFFIVVHNGAQKYEKTIKKGHERVLKARLNDAQFFYKEDQKIPLEDRVLQLKGVVFQEKLGTLYEKVLRLQKVAQKMGKNLKLTSPWLKKLDRAAYLSHADLVTEMVTEFPSLQGKMGRIYARLKKEDNEVAEALWEQYLPRPGDESLPKTLLGQVLSLANRLDTIAGFFFVGLIPTASSDPYFLRRQAQGAISILLETEFPLSLGELIKFVLEKYGSKKPLLEAKVKEVEEFFKGRLRTLFLNEGFKYDELEAVLVKSLANISDLKALLKELSRFRKGKRIEDLLTAFARCNNLANSAVGSKVEPKFLQEAAEKNLYQQVFRVEKQLAKLIGNKDFEQVLKLLASLRPPVDTLFDEVLVMTKEKRLRLNRLSLLNKTLQLFYALADFSKLVPPAN